MDIIPDIPVELERVGSGTDTTPLFRASVASDEENVELKAQFRLYSPFDDILITESGQNLLTEDSNTISVIGFEFFDSVDSQFKLNGGTVEAEYGSTLPVGIYRVSAKAVSDSSLSSPESKTTLFFVTYFVPSALRIVPWNVHIPVSPITETVKWNITIAGQIDFTLRWAAIGATLGQRTLLWKVRTPWPSVEENEDIWRRVLNG